MTTRINERFESRLANLERIQETKATGLTQLFEGYEVAQKEQFNLLQNKVFTHVDDQTNDVMQKTNEHLN
jgi:hypothetical protein